MNYLYYEGACLVIYNGNEGRVRMISKYKESTDSVVEVHIIKDPFPEIDIKVLVEEDTREDVTIIKDTILELISEDDYKRLKLKSTRAMRY